MGARDGESGGVLRERARGKQRDAVSGYAVSGERDQVCWESWLVWSAGMEACGLIRTKGINNATKMTLITTPWLTNSVDKDVLVQAIADALLTYEQGASRDSVTYYNQLT